MLGHKNSCSCVLELWEPSWSPELPCKKSSYPETTTLKRIRGESLKLREERDAWPTPEAPLDKSNVKRLKALFNLPKHIIWTSLVAQWLRIHVPMQGTRVRALVWEDPTCRGATKPMHPNY